MDWLRRGWGSNFSQTFDPHIKYHIDLTSLKKSTSDLITVSSRVINEICELYPPPYYLMVSGGMDSQIMLWCWKNSKKDFMPVSVRYTGAPDFKPILNEHDLIELEIFIKQQSISVTYMDFDIINFLENKLEDYAIKYQCTSPQITAHMCMSEMIKDGTVIFSGNFAEDFFYTYTILGLKRYAEISQRNFIPFFFLHDQELASLKTREWNSLSMDYTTRKFIEYRNLGAPVIPQPTKQTGFEIIKDYYDTRTDLVVSPNDRIRFSNMPSKRKFDLLFRYNLMKKIKYQDQVVYLRPKQQ